MDSRLQRIFSGVGGGGGPHPDSPLVDSSEQVYISSLALLKMLKHGIFRNTKLLGCMCVILYWTMELSRVWSSSSWRLGLPDYLIDSHYNAIGGCCLGLSQSHLYSEISPCQRMHLCLYCIELWSSVRFGLRPAKGQGHGNDDSIDLH